LGSIPKLVSLRPYFATSFKIVAQYWIRFFSGTMNIFRYIYIYILVGLCFVDGGLKSRKIFMTQGTIWIRSNLNLKISWIYFLSTLYLKLIWHSWLNRSKNNSKN
jgi:hypothetical protein